MTYQNSRVFQADFVTRKYLTILADAGGIIEMHRRLGNFTGASVFYAHVCI